MKKTKKNSGCSAVRTLFMAAPHRMLSKKDLLRFNRQKAKQNWKREVLE